MQAEASSEARNRVNFANSSGMVYQGEYSSEWSMILAFITLTILPTIVLFIFAQKHIVAGLTAGAVKG